VTSDALAGVTVPAATPGDPLATPTWEKARAALAARLTVGLAAAAGATAAGRPGPAAAARQGNKGEAGARKSRLCCQVRARPRRVRGALGSYFPGGRPPVLPSGRRGYGCSPAGGDRPARPSRRPG